VKNHLHYLRARTLLDCKVFRMRTCDGFNGDAKSLTSLIRLTRCRRALRHNQRFNFLESIQMNRLSQMSRAYAAHDKRLTRALVAGDRREAARLERVFGREHAARKDARADEFARLNGWERTHAFAYADMGKTRRNYSLVWTRPDWADHCLYFRERVAKGRFRFSAIVSQPYGYVEGYQEELDAFASKHGAEWSVAPVERASIYYPGHGAFIVVHMAGHVVRWLPEQQVGQ
jgi:hypothetical protein